MLDGLVCAILSDILTWELEAVAVGGLKWHGIVAIIDHWKSKFFKVSYESGQDVSLWHVKSRVLVIFYSLLNV